MSCVLAPALMIWEVFQAQCKAASCVVTGSVSPCQVERLKLEVGKRSSEQQRKTKENTVGTKRMQDLERQVTHIYTNTLV